MAKKSQNCQNCIWYILTRTGWLTSKWQGDLLFDMKRQACGFIVFVWPSYSQLYCNIIDKAKYNQVFPYTILLCIDTEKCHLGLMSKMKNYQWLHQD